jgi:hypothetical protein
MNTAIRTSIALSLVTTSAVHAEQAVQWRAADGGNGHWYLPTTQTFAHFRDASAWAQSRGAHLATLTSSEENSFAANLAPGDFLLGGYQDVASPSYSEPGGAWRWVTDEPWVFTSWMPGEPQNGGWPDLRGEHYLQWWRYEGQTSNPRWNDAGNDLTVPPWNQPWNIRAIIEWSDDCNADGIVDYGQCHNGTLPDYNGNNVPDCCERSEACVSGNYPVQWRSEDEGNGHWYLDDPQPPLRAFSARNEEAAARGAHLATVTSQPEHAFVLTVAFPTGLLGPNDMWPALGGFRNAGSTQWAWVTGEPFVYAPFSPDLPNYDQTQWLMMWGIDLYTPLLWWTGNGNTTVGRAILEWSADCNQDGIIDYGQILQGQLADTNTDGVPDVCQCATNPSLPTCCPGDLDDDATVGGADIGLLLSNWGPCGSACLYDLNNDDKVNGGDLGLLLAGWGPCSD